MPDKIHYQQFDSLGRVERVLVDSDASVNKEVHTGKSQTDNEGKGVTDIDQVLHYDYNLKGELIELRKDNNVDGTADYREFYTLDANGRIKQKEIDLTNNGSFDKREEYSPKSPEGIETVTSINIIEDPTSREKKEVIAKITYNKLDANNHIEEIKVDLLGDSSINSKETYKLNAYGRSSETLFDIDGNGSTDRREVYKYYPDGTLEKKEIDIGNTNSIDSSETYIRDALGRTTTKLLDNENNGSTNSAVHYTYDEYGRVTSVRRDSDNNLATPDYVETITYDASGNRERLYIDKTGNGVTSDDILYHFTSTNYGQHYTVTEYDPSRAGEYIKSPLEINNPNKAALRYIRTNHYDDFGRATIWEIDRDGDGKLDKAIDSTRHFSYDYDENNLNSKAFEKETSWKSINGLGKTNKIEYFEHDSFGSTKLTMIDFEGNGSIDQLVIGHAGGQADKAFHLDMTDSRDWTAEKLAKLANVRFIQLSNEQTESVLTLDQNALKALSKEVRILGDAKDTIHLEGIALRNLNSPTTIDKQIYNQYSTDIDGSTYKLIIDADINIL
ncbi:hypothetical protein HV560_00980 [Mannheimia pernigra]|uniref:YD repeat-containing protein n=1 Tax=Mannheimia pernigra TaxID=111844 RepID=A0ABD7A5Z7_9PAST|nr:hypothetical protein [Mannheimia pernigra]QLB41521.1 hypothetical protein HV560_00980 [Mannheimia pernigra]QLB43419.1 hypothetical protein HV561_00815 [Mannheimia pernigra]